MSMLEIKNVHKSFFTYTKPRLQAGIFHRPGARKVTSELLVLRLSLIHISEPTRP